MLSLYIILVLRLFLRTFFYLEHNHMHPKWKENGDKSVGGNCILSAKYQVKVAGHFVLSITDH